MTTTKTFLCLLFPFFFFSSLHLNAQSVSITDDGSVAHPSAMLDVKLSAAAKKGILIPRITTAQRNAIASPAKGLLVYDSTVRSFWFHNGTAWTQLSTGSANPWTINGINMHNNITGNVGIGLTVPKSKLHVAPYRSVIFGSDSLIPSGTPQFVWFSGRGAVRFRSNFNPFPDPVPYSYAEVGYNSFAFGNNAISSGESSLSIGDGRATGLYSFAQGWGIDASGVSSYCRGFYNSANGSHSFAQGNTVSAAGEYAFAQGFIVEAKGSHSTAFGLQSTASGEFSTAIGELTTAQGNYSTAIGQNLLSKAAFSVALGRFNDAIVSSSITDWVANDPLFIIGNGSETTRNNAFVVLKNGRTGILKNPGSTANADASLQVKSLVGGFHALSLEASGSTNKWSFGVVSNMTLHFNNVLRGTFNSATGAYTAVSDIRLKKDVISLGIVLPALLKLKTYTYHLKDNNEEDPLSFGLMAQEVEKIFPQLVTSIDDRELGKVYGLNYDNFTVLTIKAIQEQDERINHLEHRINDQDKMISDLLKRLQALENIK